MPANAPSKSVSLESPSVVSPSDMSRPPRAAVPKQATHWQNLLFLVGLHATGCIGLTLYWLHRAPSVVAVVLVAAGFALTTFGISAGYHRLFAHRSYTTGRALKGALLLLGAAAVQNSALTWATKHRLHHQHTDTDRDPYNARRGFWYSHIGWVVSEDPEDTCDTSDLQSDRLVQAQHRWYLPLALCLGFGLPTLVGWGLGDALGGFLFGGVWRLLLSYHATFSINSFAHWIGTQPYSTKGTARDNLLAAIVTMGEGYHNFHHTFPGDYRNGVRFFDFDPPKWVLAALASFGWIKDVRRTPGHVIALRRLKTARQHLEQKASLPPTERRAMVARADKLKQLLTQWSKACVPRTNTRETDPPAVIKSRREFWKAFNDWESELTS